MYEIGRKQILTVEKKVDFGVFLRDPEEKFSVLLPGSQVPEGCAAGDRLEVFLYKDSEDRPIATRKEPKLQLHEVGWLTAVQITKIGAFLDWGLDKDLLLPFHEQPRKRIQKGQECLVAVYIDKSSRLCATMNVYPYLRTDSPYHTGDQVEGTVYETSSNFGTFVAVDDIYSALIPRKELVRELEIGSRIRARVLSVKPDGKLDLSIREKAYLQIGEDAEFLLAELEKNGGRLPFTDKSDPEIIRSSLHMSKNEFKRAAGHLMKEGAIRMTPEGIERI
ncbi:MAG: S1 RNA-binding domain-containing protein [Lachnospiraceae bacterium]|nr:S1 RNA-binding domain-containing protein [Lachnospiraceae bacterium]